MIATNKPASLQTTSKSSNLVGGVAGAAEHGRAHAYKESLFRYFPHELRVRLVVLLQSHG